MDVNNQTFSFTTHNPKAGWYFTIILIFIPIGFLLDFLSLSKTASSVIFVLSILLSIVLSLLLVIKNFKQKEIITVHSSYLDSQRFGRLPFGEIEKVTFSPVKVQPNVVLILKDGRQCKWLPWYKGETDKKECKLFKNQLMTALNQETYEYAESGISKGNQDVIEQLPQGHQQTKPVIDFEVGQESKGLLSLIAIGKRAHPYRFIIFAMGILLILWIRSCR